MRRTRVETTAAPPDADGLRGLAERLAGHGQPICAAIESMNGARFVHDALERWAGTWRLADAQKVKGLAPLAAKTDRIDAFVLAELARRDLVPAIWLPDAGGARRARAGALPPPPGASPRGPQGAHPRDLDRPRPLLPGRRPLRACADGRCSIAFALPEPWAATTAASLR